MYVQSALIKDEQVLYQAKLHWIVYFTMKAFLTFFLAAFIDMKTSEFAITNKRVIVKYGWISRRTLELNLTKIEAVNIDQDIGGRMFGYGTVNIVGTGGTINTLKYIADPLAFRKRFQECTL